jgi:hypothetical protein
MGGRNQLGRARRIRGPRSFYPWVFTALAVAVRPENPRLAAHLGLRRTALLGLLLFPDLPLHNRDLCQ